MRHTGQQVFFSNSQVDADVKAILRHAASEWPLTLHWSAPNAAQRLPRSTLRSCQRCASSWSACQTWASRPCSTPYGEWVSAEVSTSRILDIGAKTI